MSKSLIQVSNQSTQAVEEDSIISLGTTQRRYGCNLRLSGNGIEVTGAGYYKIDGTVSVAPTAVGPVTVAVYDNGSPIPGLVAYDYAATAEQPVTVPLIGTIRQGCACNGADNLTVVLVEGAGDVVNISLRIEKS